MQDRNTQSLLDRAFADDVYGEAPFMAGLRTVEAGLVLDVLADVRATLPAAPLILDCGCDKGNFVAILDLDEVYGLDLNIRRITQSPHRQRYQIIVQADAAAMPFPSSFFDIVLCNSMLEHTQDPAGILREIGRVLRPDGHLAATVPTEAKPHTTYFGDDERMTDHEAAARYRDYHCERFAHHYLLQPAEWCSLVTSARMVVKDAAPYESRALGEVELLDEYLDLRGLKPLPAPGIGVHDAPLQVFWKLIRKGVKQCLEEEAELVHRDPSKAGGLFIHAVKEQRIG